MEEPPAEGQKLAVSFKVVAVRVLGSIVVVVFKAYSGVVGGLSC